MSELIRHSWIYLPWCFFVLKDLQNAVKPFVFAEIVFVFLYDFDSIYIILISRLLPRFIHNKVFSIISHSFLRHHSESASSVTLRVSGGAYFEHGGDFLLVWFVHGWCEVGDRFGCYHMIHSRSCSLTSWDFRISSIIESSSSTLNSWEHLLNSFCIA